MNNKSIFEKEVLKPFLESLEKNVNQNAFCINERFYTYNVFRQYISNIRFLIADLKKDDIYVGLVVNDDIETYASIFSLWLNGKAYIPLHPKQPIERNKEIIQQMGISFILDSSIDTRYSEFNTLKTKDLELNAEYTIELDEHFEDESIAYILFTSGSTGKPKGVKVNRGNLGAFMDSFWSTGIDLNGNDRCLQTFDLTFDVSIQSFLVPLVKGACVYTVPHDQIKYSYIFGLLEDHKITFGAMAPSLLRYLRPYFSEIDLPSMKTCIVTAEASPLDLILEWQNCMPNATIFNFYGPTEATIYCTFYEVKKDGGNLDLNGMLSIGKPLKNVKAIIVDERNEIVPKGAKGELCVAGSQITPGYWKDKQNNEKAFFEKIYNEKKQRFYHTGDLCYMEEQENLMLYGRLDSQVKIQGYRIELGEIEFHARDFLKTINVVVLPFLNKSKNTELALFLEDESQNIDSLLKYLKTKLPSYMIPTKTIGISEFPLNNNGKIDKNLMKETIT